MTGLSWNRSIVCPYLITTGSADSTIINHDIRVKNSVVNVIQLSDFEHVSQLKWSTNESHEFMRNNSDPSTIYLAGATYNQEHKTGSLNIWRLSDFSYQGQSKLHGLIHSNSPSPAFHLQNAHNSPIKAMSWNPSQHGLLATGGFLESDQIIKLWSLNSSSSSKEPTLEHSICTNSPLTSLSWRKARHTPQLNNCMELVSTHETVIKVW